MALMIAVKVSKGAHEFFLQYLMSTCNHTFGTLVRDATSGRVVLEG